MKRAPLLIGLGIVALAAGAFGIFSWQRSAQNQALLVAAIPACPDLQAWSPMLVQRIDSCEQRIIAGQDAAGALAELSRLYHANGFYPEAMACYDALAQVQPDEPRWPHRHAAILAGYGDDEAALPYWEHAVALAPVYTPAGLRFGDVLLKSNQFERAATAYEAVLKVKPDEAYALLGLARCDFEAGRWEEARQHLEKLVAQTNYTLGYDLIVTVYERLGMPDRAAAIRGRARTFDFYRDPPDPWVDDLIEDCYDPFRLSLVAGRVSMSGDPDTGIRLLERALSITPDASALHFQLGNAFLAMKSYGKAREHFEQCTKLRPEFPDGWIYLSDLYFTLGNRAAADRTLQEGLRHSPKSPGMHLTLARRLAKDGRTDEAIPEFKLAIEYRPNEADAYIDLATLYIKTGRQADAIPLLQRALVAEPGHPFVLCTLAFHAIESGDEAAARDWMKRASDQPRTQRSYLNQLQEAFRTRFGHAPN